MTKKSTILSAALAGVLLTSCATTDPNQEPSTEAQGGSELMVTPQERGAFDIERKAGKEGGLTVPSQRVTPIVGTSSNEKEPKKDGDMAKGEKTALKVEPLAGSSGSNVSREPGPEGGLRIPKQLVVPIVKPKDKEPSSGLEP